jgi:hypothetical protein
MEKVCLECGDPIKGRVDKKFCSDQCRNAYHNKENTDSNNYIRNVNNILRKNRRILAELNPSGKTTVSKEKLIARGFLFTYFTNTYTNKTGNVYYYCYEHGYVEFEKGLVTLVQKDKNHN